MTSRIIQFGWLFDLRKLSTTFSRLAYFSFFCTEFSLRILTRSSSASFSMLTRFSSSLIASAPICARNLRAVVLARLAVLLLVEQLVLLQLGLARIDDDVALEVEDALEIAQRDVEQVADAARQPLEEPHVADRRGQRDVAEPLAAHLGLRHLDAALVADHAAVLHALVLAAEALPVGDRAEDLRAEQAVALRLERAVVDRLRLGHLAERPRHDLVGRRERDADRVEVGAQRRSCCRGSLVSWLHLLQYRFVLSATAAASTGGCFFVEISSTSRQSDCSSRMSTLNDSGSPGVNDASPLTIAS